ncbi:MAG: UDP-N-acetylmuramate--L-alanine ligase [Clostridia bacterium]|nr:UDP-N-acetylmuramate--L-alanine ligase [Clostridia bacterium]
MSVENTHHGAAAIAALLSRCRSIFFIGIGGISMSALAELSASNGFAVGGSDKTETELTQRLCARGIKVFYGHEAAHVDDYDAVVYTVAIDAKNPEYLAAKQAGKPLLSRADYLGYLMTGFSSRVGVAGMHGKSTCTAMCTSIFLAAGDPTVLCGAALPALGNSPCRIGEGREHLVFEACEYMDSFLDFNPTLAVVLNIGMDHVDYFHSMEQIHASFLAYAERTGEGGKLLYNADDVESVNAFLPFRGSKISFGLENDADFTAKNAVSAGGVTAFDFCHKEKKLCRISLRAIGKHNLYNALAAASAATLCKISPEIIAKGLSEFRGASRRMEYKGTLPSGATVYDDYGHHPDEIRATLSGARELGFSRVLCAYQPHTYSRTAGLFDEFSAAFADVDRVFFADIYAAREENLWGVTSKALADRIGEKALACGSFSAVAEAIQQEAKKDDLVIVMGAGDIYHVFDLLKWESKA